MLKFFVFLVVIMEASCESEDLYNTKTATSDLQWTTHPVKNGWEEVSGHDVNDRAIRFYQVCKYQDPETSNWVRTPFISTREARRAYIDVEFSMMKCDELHSNCREIFNLYYFEADRDEASSTYPPWRENPYVKIDTIAAGERFSTSDEDLTEGINFKTWTLGPVTRRGFYIAAHDTGACMSILSLRVYYHYCPETVKSMAHFSRTVAGDEVASLHEVHGRCVSNANISSPLRVPRYYCNSDGQWKVSTGMCHCKPGYQAGRRMTMCEDCGLGRYKSSYGNHECLRCPKNSMTVGEPLTTSRGPDKKLRFAAESCICNPGYYRSANEDVHASCTKPPTKPTEVRFNATSSSVTLEWSHPVSNGGRNDLYYNISCNQCFAKKTSETETSLDSSCVPCSDNITFHPTNNQRISSNRLAVLNLRSFENYRFEIMSMNGVTSVSQTPPAAAIVKARTDEAEPSPVINVLSPAKGMRNITLTWSNPIHKNGVISKYEVIWTDITSSLNTDSKTFTEVPMTLETKQLKAVLTDLKPGHSYSVRIRAATSAGYGAYSRAATFRTSHDVPAEIRGQASASNGVAVGVGVGLLLLILLVAVLLYFASKKKCINSKRQRDKLTIEEHEALKGATDGTFMGEKYPVHQSHRTYIEYPDPIKAMQEFACEIMPSCLKVENSIGQGEFGEVCRGILRERDGREIAVAVKKMKGGMKDQFSFLREASTMAQFSHPNVVELKGVVTKSRPQMIITEYMEYGSLDSFLKRKRGELSVLQMIEMLKGIASGMRYLSSMQYVHRDLAARNILVDSNLNCKVSDFGLSRTLENDPHATYTTQGGKIALRWTAPECIRYRTFTSASDVWSYGITMWEVMSYGEKPYWEMTNEEVMTSIEEGYRLPAPYECPVYLHRLMVECWCLNPTQRPKMDGICYRLDQLKAHPEKLEKVNLHKAVTPTTPITDDYKPFIPSSKKLGVAHT